MGGIGHKKGWAWIFILEGLATVLVRILFFWMVFDFSDNATFLSDIYRQRVIRRLKSNQQSSAKNKEFKTTYLSASVKDWKTYTSAIIYMGCDKQILFVILRSELCILPALMSLAKNRSLK